MNISQLDMLLFSIVVLTIYVLFGSSLTERFQRMNYIQLHNYLENAYSYPRSMFYSPYRSYIPTSNEYPTVGLTGTRGYHDDYLSYPQQSYNPDRLVGYLYSEAEDNNEVYKLYEVYDHRRGRPGYAYKATKYPNNRDSILVNIDPKTYSGDYLYDGDTVDITYEKIPFTVKMYQIKQTGLGTRYTNKDYRSGMHEYALLEPVDPGANVDEEDRYFILYEQEIDPSRQLNNYYIKDKRGIIIEVSNKEKIYDGDTLLIPGKEKYGEYSVKEMDRF
jgi:hypothetical protein